MKVLINVPRLRRPDGPGGVANYYLAMRSYLDDQKVYFEIGKTDNRRGFLRTLRRMLADFVAFYRRLGAEPFDLVHLNPSLNTRSVLRDGLFLLIAKVRRKKVLVFFRGWEKDFEETLRSRWSGLFTRVYGRADAFIVLAEEFRTVLEEFGLNAPVWLDTTVVSDQVLQHSVERTGRAVDRFTVLYMSRIEQGKGCELAIRAFALMRLGGIDGRLVIAGKGGRREAAEALVTELAVPDVEFTGYISGEDKASAFLSADVFLYPTAYGEGMPNAVLEAMGYGLPVITRPVAGLRDFFRHTKMGYISDSQDPDVFAGYLRKLAMSPELRTSIGQRNREYAADRFAASRVAKRLEGYYERTVGL
jgi:glycosyltransferase involved in cell wall biosynthesis